MATRKPFGSVVGGVQLALNPPLNNPTTLVHADLECESGGHLLAVAKIFGHLSNCKTASTKLRTGIPDCSKLIQEQQTEFDWSYICGGVKEMVPEGMPEPKGKCVRITLFVDTNLGHDKVTGRSCTGIFTVLNLTPIDSHCKLQNTVETATYGSEFTGARIAVDKMFAERYKL